VQSRAAGDRGNFSSVSLRHDHDLQALSDKQNDEHEKACAEITVERWRDECLYWDWSDSIIEHKLSVIARAILQVDDGRGADIIALQEVENISILERLRTEYLAELMLRSLRDLSLPMNRCCTRTRFQDSTKRESPIRAVFYRQILFCRMARY
jgi:hypothetical protein